MLINERNTPCAERFTPEGKKFESNQDSSEQQSKSGYGWTSEQLDFLKLNYDKMSYPQIAKHIGKKPVAVSVKAMRMGLVKPETNNKGNFKKDHQRNQTVPEHTVQRVKKGNTHIMRIKIGRNWEYYHRHVWEMANGTIPPGYNIYFKDGNSENCELSNLELSNLRDGLLKRQPNSEQRSEIAKKWWDKKRINEPKSEKVRTPKKATKALDLVEAFDARIREQVNSGMPGATNRVQDVYAEMKAKGLVPVRSEDGKTVRFVRPEKIGLPPVVVEPATVPVRKPQIVEPDEDDDDFDIQDMLNFGDTFSGEDLV